MPDWDKIANDLIDNVSVLPRDRRTVNATWFALLEAKEIEDKLRQAENLIKDLSFENTVLRTRLSFGERMQAAYLGMVQRFRENYTRDFGAKSAQEDTDG